MHELSLAESILDGVRKTLDSTPGAAPLRVGIVVGAMAAVDMDALRFCFEIAVEGTELRQLKLEARILPAELRCLACGFTTLVESTAIDCRQCGSARTVMSGSDELDLEYLVVERDGNDHAEAESLERERQDCRGVARAV